MSSDDAYRANPAASPYLTLDGQQFLEYPPDLRFDLGAPFAVQIAARSATDLPPHARVLFAFTTGNAMGLAALLSPDATMLWILYRDEIWAAETPRDETGTVRFIAEVEGESIRLLSEKGPLPLRKRGPVSGIPMSSRLVNSYVEVGFSSIAALADEMDCRPWIGEIRSFQILDVPTAEDSETEAPFVIAAMSRDGRLRYAEAEIRSTWIEAVSTPAGALQSFHELERLPRRPLGSVTITLGPAGLWLGEAPRGDATDAGSETRSQTYTLDPADPITQIVGWHDHRAVQSVQFVHASGKTSASFATSEDSPSRTPFVLTVPSGDRFRGWIGASDHNGIVGMGLMHSRVDGPAAAILVEATRGRWVDDLQQPPQRNDGLAIAMGMRIPMTGEVRIHGNYVAPSAYRFIPGFDRGNRSLELYDVASGTVLMAHYVWSDAAGAFMDDGGRPLDFQADGSRVRVPLDESTLTLSRPRPYERDHSEKLPWGATFSLNERPSLVEASFYGYDVTTLHPRNLQLDLGGPMIFDYPNDDGSAYSTSNNKIIIPHGLHLSYDSEGSEQTTVETITSANEHQRSHRWAVGADLSVGAGAFSANESYKLEHSRMDRSTERHESEWSIARTIETRYALVHDRSRGALSAEFLRDAHAIGDFIEAGGSDKPLRAVIADFVAKYGTHYPLAVTFGGMAYLQSEYTKNELESASEDSWSTEIEMHAKLGDLLGGGGSFSYSTESKDSSESSNAKRREIFRTYGGSLSRGSGWSLPVGSEVPILMDLRPIQELFNPLHFDREVMWRSAKPAVASYIQSYLEGRGFKAPAELEGIAGLKTFGERWYPIFTARSPQGGMPKAVELSIEGGQLVMNHETAFSNVRFSRLSSTHEIHGQESEDVTWFVSVAGTFNPHFLAPFDQKFHEDDPVYLRAAKDGLGSYQLALTLQNSRTGKALRVPITDFKENRRMLGASGNWRAGDDLRDRSEHFKEKGSGDEISLSAQGGWLTVRHHGLFRDLKLEASHRGPSVGQESGDRVQWYRQASGEIDSGFIQEVAPGAGPGARIFIRQEIEANGRANRSSIQMHVIDGLETRATFVLKSGSVGSA